MTRQQLIQYIKENDSHYKHFERFTFNGHSYRDLVHIKEKIDQEKKEAEQAADLIKLPRALKKILRPSTWWQDK